MTNNKLIYTLNLTGLAVSFFLLVSNILKSLISLLYKSNLGKVFAFSENLSNTVNLFYSLLALILTCVFIKYLQKKEFAVFISFGKVKNKSSLTLFALFMVCIPITIIVSTFFSMGVDKILSFFSWYLPKASIILPDCTFALFLSFVTICIVPAILEEYIFRCLLLRSLSPLGKWCSIIIVSIFFTLSHGDMTQFLSIFVLSLFLGYAAYISNGILLPILMHFFNNSLSWILIYDTSKLDKFSGTMLTLIILLAIFLVGGSILIMTKLTPLTKLVDEPKIPPKTRMAIIKKSQVFWIGLGFAFVVSLLRTLSLF